MSLYDYRWSRWLYDRVDPPFYGLLMAMIRKADEHNLERIRRAWPDVVREFELRYHAPGARLENDPPDSEATP